MKNICLINGSLRGKEASSLVFLNEINRRLDDKEYNKTFITVKARVKDGYPEETLKSIADADAVIMAFPLYTYGLPGALMRLLEEYYLHVKNGQRYNHEARLYIVINCAFTRPVVISEAVRVMKNFCRRLSLYWRFGIYIGAGPVTVMTSKVPFLNLKLKKAFREMASDIKRGDLNKKNDYFIKPIVPEPILFMIKAQYEKKMKANMENNRSTVQSKAG